ncbi:MAG: hypothetical protein ACFCUV_14500, partial [Rivularia sp. (in: cyanobacteria)]
MSAKWELVGEQLAQKLQSLKTEEEIKTVCGKVVTEIEKSYELLNSRKKPLATVRKEVLKFFPDSEEQENSLQYFTNSGKGNVPRYQHLAIKYLSFSQENWDELGGQEREEWKQQQQASSQKQIKLLIDMNNEQTAIDFPEIAQLAMQELGIEPIELINRALVFYSKSIIGKAKRHEEDLSNFSTEDLLNDKKFSTHPLRASELTKRAIVAIQIHNSQIATEN